VHQKPGSLDVGEEVVTEAGSHACPLDQAGNVGEHELALVGFERPKHGLECGEGVVGDLRPRAGDAGEQRGFTRVRKADQTHIGQ